MDCRVIEDLMILYADGCCSDESKAAVEEHVRTCASCRKELEEMKTAPEEAAKNTAKTVKLTRVNIFKASLLQAALLFAAFSVLTCGVAKEAATPVGETNGLWAATVVIPAASFLLSLANWFFIRFYPSKKAFSHGSFLATCLFTVFGAIWAVWHYPQLPSMLFNGGNTAIFLCISVLLPALSLAASAFCSAKYAALLGKE